MIAAAAFVVALAAAPQRDRLIERWERTDRTHTQARLEATVRGSRAAAPDLAALAMRELATRGRYQIAEPPAAPHEPWWMAPLRWIGDRWDQLWRRISSRVHVGRNTAANVGDVVLVLLGLLILFVVVRLLVNLQIARDASRNESVPLDETPSPRALYKAACAAAAQGDYGTATLLLFAAMLALFEQRGNLRPATSATIGDLRRELRGNDASLVGTFDAVAALFIQRAYAERRIDQSQWDRARAAFDRVLAPQQALQA